MGAVYAVAQRSTGRRRALKVMLPSTLADDGLRARFALEAQIAARIASDHVVDVFAAGVDPTTNVPWLVMELLEGEDLAATLRARERLPPHEVAAVFSQLGHALSRAHAAGVVHRDLKPANIFLASPRAPGLPWSAWSEVVAERVGRARGLTDARSSAPNRARGSPPRWIRGPAAGRRGLAGG